MNPIHPTQRAIDPQWLDVIVRKVMEKLSQQTGQTTDSTTKDPQPELSDRAEVVLTERVISLDSLRDRLTKGCRLVVDPRAIVTPAVRDELRDRNVTLERREPATASVVESSKKIACFVQGSLTRLEPSQMGLPVQLVDANGQDWGQLTNEISKRCGDRGRAIIVALEPYRAVCELNRNGVLRAGYAPTSSALGKLAQQLAPNVIVLDSRRCTHATIREVCDELARIAASAAPLKGEAS